ncbi:hypothetical protein SHAM105786_03925 [Shewanella amazonensis]|uniref:GRAM domain-containing protein n=1 Tax=Shewanella amazonensis (strain ATCC BAA-1098 / SB2B) TaxID=326297 RepID=A1S4L0_SHEAM|nr:hypothetical protein [Shewanella amazonensis]ABL99316.1 conserved hypothetical protein [Shewanella amazonensis SB2B]
MSQPQNAASLSHPDSILKSATAAVQRGVARADGKLCLTSSSLEFTPYNTQFGLGPYQLSRTEIAKAEKCLGKGGGILPVTRDALRISLRGGDSYEFIVANPEDWIAALGA